MWHLWPGDEVSKLMTLQLPISSVVLTYGPMEIDVYRRPQCIYFAQGPPNAAIQAALPISHVKKQTYLLWYLRFSILVSVL